MYKDNDEDDENTGRWHTSPSLLCLAAFSHRLSSTFFGMNETWEAVKCRTSRFQNSAMHTFIIRQYNQVLKKYPTAPQQFLNPEGNAKQLEGQVRPLKSWPESMGNVCSF